MSRRILVSAVCEKRCPSCVACQPNTRVATLDQALAEDPGPDRPLVLGGGDATRWPPLTAFLAANRARPQPRKIWLEAPAASFTPDVLRDLAAQGVEGVRIQIEALGPAMIKALGVGDGRGVIAGAEAFGLATEVRACVRPKTLPITAPLARQIAPRQMFLEIARQDWGQAPVALNASAIDADLATVSNVQFTSHRLTGNGFLPPCMMPKSWRLNPRLWQGTDGERESPNDVLPACGACVLNRRCGFSDVGALSTEDRERAQPILKEAPVHRVEETAVPEIIVRKRKLPDVICTEPWTTIESTGEYGHVHQCGGNWTAKTMGNLNEKSLMDIWNDKPFQDARRAMGQASVGELCRPICTRLYDGVLHEKQLKVQAGSEPFVRNQLLLAEEMADRREILSGMPLHMSLFPSSYCNYDCVFCHFGRSPRIDMPDRVWDELPQFLPTLRTLTLLGGEPFASQRVWEFLTTFDTTKYPDVRVDIFTNGSLMTEKALRRVQSSSLGEITISLNSGTADVYDQVERGAATFDQVMQNVDALIRFRDDYQWWFGITLSLIVMRENAHTLIQFGQLALERNLPIRLVGLLIARPEHDHLHFYKNPDEVRAVAGHLDRFIEWARHVGRADYVKHAVAAREAVIENASAATGIARASLVPLRIAS